MKLDELIARFADNAGIDDATPVEGVWKFSADGNVFGMTTNDTDDKVWIFGEVALPDPERKDAFLRSAMEANYFHRGTGGATFSLNPDTGALTLFASERLDGLGNESFFSLVEKFVNTLATWNGIASATHQGESSPAGGGEGGPAADAGQAPARDEGMGRYMQV